MDPLLVVADPDAPVLKRMFPDSPPAAIPLDIVMGPTDVPPESAEANVVDPEPVTPLPELMLVLPPVFVAEPPAFICTEPPKWVALPADRIRLLASFNAVPAENSRLPTIPAIPVPAFTLIPPESISDSPDFSRISPDSIVVPVSIFM